MARNFTAYPKTPSKLRVYGDTLCKYNSFSFVKDSFIKDLNLDYNKSLLTDGVANEVKKKHNLNHEVIFPFSIAHDIHLGLNLFSREDIPPPKKKL